MTAKCYFYSVGSLFTEGIVIKKRRFIYVEVNTEISG